MKDYETLYYEVYFKYKNLLKEKECLEQELEIIKKINKSKNKNEIAKVFIEYINKK